MQAGLSMAVGSCHQHLSRVASNAYSSTSGSIQCSRTPGHAMSRHGGVHAVKHVLHNTEGRQRLATVMQVCVFVVSRCVVMNAHHRE